MEGSDSNPFFRKDLIVPAEKLHVNMRGGGDVPASRILQVADHIQSVPRLEGSVADWPAQWGFHRLQGQGRRFSTGEETEGRRSRVARQSEHDQTNCQGFFENFHWIILCGPHKGAAGVLEIQTACV